MTRKRQSGTESLFSYRANKTRRFKLVIRRISNHKISLNGILNA
jgi:hypothetical protein